METIFTATKQSRTLAFCRQKYRASPCADHYRLAAMSVPKRQPVAPTSQGTNTTPFGSSLDRDGADAHAVGP